MKIIPKLFISLLIFALKFLIALAFRPNDSKSELNEEGSSFFDTEESLFVTNTDGDLVEANREAHELNFKRPL